MTDNYGECGTSIVFAETRGKAIMYALQWIDSFEDLSWPEVRAKRFKEYDQYYDGRTEVDFWLDDEHRIRLVRDFGWSCFEVFEYLCKDCPAKEWCEKYEVDSGKRFTLTASSTWEYETETIDGEMTEEEWEEQWG